MKIDFVWLKSIFNLIPIHYFKTKKESIYTTSAFTLDGLSNGGGMWRNGTEIDYSFKFWTCSTFMYSALALSRFSAIIKAVKISVCSQLIPFYRLLTRLFHKRKVFRAFQIMSVQLSSRSIGFWLRWCNSQAAKLSSSPQAEPRGILSAHPKKLNPSFIP